jgi:energy-coupling factor transport system permease protein
VAATYVYAGWLLPAMLLTAWLSLALASGRGRPAALMLVAALPLLISVAVIDGVFSGIGFAAVALVRIGAALLAISVASLNIEVTPLLDDLEARHLGRRFVYVAGASVSVVPSLRSRAAAIVEAQRARGLETEGAAWRRLRGVVPVAAPLVTRSLIDVEDRVLALESRAFSHPGRRARLRPSADSDRQRALRWLLVAAAAATVVARVAGTPMP